MVTKAQSYTESSIKVFQGLHGIRQKASMYVGELEDHAIFHCVKEFVDNALDENMAGRNDVCRVVVTDDNRVVVADESSGIPIGLNKQLNISTLTALFMHLHAGGKFDNKSFKVSSGTHGVGLKACTALSEVLEVWTNREGIWYHQKFGKGEIITPLAKARPSQEVRLLLGSPQKKGTIIFWTPDLSIIGKKAKANFSDIKFYLESLAGLNTDFKISFKSIIKGKETTDIFHNTVGPLYYLDALTTKLSAVAEGKPISIVAPHVDLAFQLTNFEEADGFKSYVTSSLTVDGGKHLDGFWQAFTKAIGEFSNNRHKYSPRDLRYGLVGFLNLRISGPKFSSQTKEKLVGFAVEGEKVGQLISDRQLELEKPDQAIEKYLFPLMKAAFTKNKTFPKLILERATQVAKAREKGKELMKAASKLKVKDKHDPLPDVLYTATKATAESRELYIVEGDSAGGCFIKSTPVLQSDGSVLTFGEMVSCQEKGEKLFGMSWDIENNKKVVVEFDEPRIIKFVTELIEVELSDGTIFTCTSDHPWLLSNGSYVSAEQLIEGQELQTI